MHTNTLSLLFAAATATAQSVPGFWLGYASGSNLVSSGGSFGSTINKIDKCVRLDGDARNEDDACDNSYAVASDDYEDWNGDDGVNFCGYEVYDGWKIVEPGATWDDPKGEGLTEFCGKDVGDKDMDGRVYGMVINQEYGVGSGLCYYRTLPNQPYNCANCGVGSCLYSFGIECEASSA